MQSRLCSVYVPASPRRRAVSTELCLARGGAPALAGHDSDDDDARTTHPPNTGVPGECGTPVLALQIPSNWGTQETPAKEGRYEDDSSGQPSSIENLPSLEAQNARKFQNCVGGTSGGTYGGRIRAIRAVHLATGPTFPYSRRKLPYSTTKPSPN